MLEARMLEYKNVLRTEGRDERTWWCGRRICDEEDERDDSGADYCKDQHLLINQREPKEPINMAYRSPGGRRERGYKLPNRRSYRISCEARVSGD